MEPLRCLPPSPSQNASHLVALYRAYYVSEQNQTCARVDEASCRPHTEPAHAIALQARESAQAGLGPTAAAPLRMLFLRQSYQLVVQQI